VAERTNAPALKAGGPQGPGVQIPPVPLCDVLRHSIDDAFARWRLCYEEDPSLAWLNTVERGRRYAAGDVLGCMGVRFAGPWYTPEAVGYINRIQAEYDRPSF